MKKKVVVTHDLHPAGIDLLKTRYDVTVLPLKNNEGIKPDCALLKDCDALIPVLSDAIDDALLTKAPQLKIIANYAVGYNNVNIAAVRKHRVMVSNTPDVLTDATVEIAFVLMLCLTRKILPADRFTREGHFNGWDTLSFMGDELTGKNIGILGMGRIGQAMAARCKAFGMHVLYHNRKHVASEIEASLGARYCSLDELLAESDVLSIHSPLTPETKHLLNQETFQKMKTGSYLVNTGRGPVVDEAALVQALQSGKLKGAGLDVYEFEPSVQRELIPMENVVLLPHIGSATVEARSKMSLMAANNVIEALEGKKPTNLIPELADLF